MASVSKWSCKVISLLCLLFILPSSLANDILGCGGFIKSHVNLDFSKVQVKLFTKQGSLKEKTECAPNNGYYFLPLYEPGEYVLKIDPPAGWSIEPAEISLNVDGESDPCSLGQDVNFEFTGFGITGRVVTAGDVVGPTGVSVQLIGEKGEIRETKTKVSGDFHFTPVIPGKYTVKAYHSKWKLEPFSTLVQVVGGNTALKVGSLAVKGYDVRGKVTSDGRPIAGVHVLLYSDKDTKLQFKIEGCNTALLPGVSGNPICYVVSAPNGEFSFGLVPAGAYSLVPVARTPGQSKITFNLQPTKADFKVQHDSVNLGNTFEVSGFSVEGRVVSNPGGAGIGGAHVSLVGHPTVVTGKDGYYMLTNLKASTHNLKIAAEGCEFDDLPLTITQSGVATLQDASPSRWRVCGAVRSPAVGPSRPRTVLLQPTPPPASAPRQAGTKEDGTWCVYLQPGVYLASVDVSDEDRREGMQFFPVSQKITVAYSPLDGITFSQLKATLTGTIRCMKDSQVAGCLASVVTLRPLSLDGSYTGQPITTVAKADGKYTLKEVLPGSYEVSVPTESLCWSSAKHNIAVNSAEATVPEFVHTGYAVSFAMSHKSEIQYTTGTNIGVLDVQAGVSQHCLPTSGDYVFTPKGCHIYDPPTVTHSTRQANKMFVINAVSHSVGITIFADEVVDDLQLKIGRDPRDVVGPLTPLPQKQDGMFVYRHTVMLSQGGTVLVTPMSGQLLFSPAGPHYLGGAPGGHCVESGLQFTATRGTVLTGTVTPAIAGVVVTLSGGDMDEAQTTGDDGKYRFGPLDSSLEYTLTAEKENYIITGPNNAGNFMAQKLGEIIVKVIDSVTKEPLPSCLVSVSGGTSYRRNLATGADGSLSFPALAPLEYYIKPLMKEYKFSPPHRIHAIQAGETFTINLEGVRVACSGVGHILTLGGGGVGGVNVMAAPAAGQDPSRCAAEEGVSERDTGAFRVRGLLRGCKYEVRIKAPREAGITHVIPPFIDVDVKSEAEDIEGMKFVAVQPLLVTDVTVLVLAPKLEHYKTLKLRLATEMEPTSSVFSTKLDASGYAPGINAGLMITLPRLPADNRTYLVQLDSSLSKNTHTFSLEPIYFNADGKFKHFQLRFEPKVKAGEQDLNQPSILILPFIGLLVLAFLNKEKVLDVLSGFAGVISEKVANAAAQSKQNSAKNVQNVLDDSQIDQLVQNINAVKKRPKLRKV